MNGHDVICNERFPFWEHKQMLNVSSMLYLGMHVLSLSYKNQDSLNL